MEWLTNRMRAQPLRTALGFTMQLTSLTAIALIAFYLRTSGILAGVLGLIALVVLVAGSFVIPHEPKGIELAWRERHDEKDLEELLR